MQQNKATIVKGSWHKNDNNNATKKISQFKYKKRKGICCAIYIYYYSFITKRKDGA